MSECIHTIMFSLSALNLFFQFLQYLGSNIFQGLINYSFLNMKTENSTEV